MNLEKRTIEILAQVVYKELAPLYNKEMMNLAEIDVKEDTNYVERLRDKFWSAHKEQTLELARNILRVNTTINPIKQ